MLMIFFPPPAIRRAASTRCTRRKAWARAWRLGWLALALAASASPGQATPYQLVFPRPENGDPNQPLLQFSLLQLALEKTIPQYGAYTLAYTDAKMNHARAVAEIKSDNGLVNVMVRTHQNELAAELLALPVPVDRGIVGYRVLLIRKGDEARFAHIATLADLRQIHFGTHTSYSDVKMFPANGLDFTGAGSVEGLFKMLASKRFDAISQDIEEVQRHLESVAGLEIEPHLLLHYPAARIYYFPRTVDGQANYERIKAGLDIMIKDGSFLRVFQALRGNALKNIKLGGRTLIELENPLLPRDSPLRDSPILLKKEELHIK